MPITIPVDGILGLMIAEFPELFRDGASDQRLQTRRLALAFLTYLLGDSRIPRQRSIPESIQNVIHQINQQPAYSWSNPELANIVSMSTESFIRLFKRWTGETPMRFVQQVRVREACRLLAETDSSIDEIASQTGFPDRFYFSRVFKRHTNHSPAAYRRATRSMNASIDSMQDRLPK
jgi:transcriptional regulator GlxA family with amidase domain